MTRRKPVHVPNIVDSREFERVRGRRPSRERDTVLATEETIEDTLSQWWEDLVVRPLEALGLVWYEDEDAEDGPARVHHPSAQPQHAAQHGTFHSTAQHASSCSNPANEAPHVARISTYGSTTFTSDGGSSSMSSAANSSGGRSSRTETGSYDSSSSGGGSSCGGGSSSSSQMKHSASASYMERLLPIDGLLDMQDNCWSPEDPKKSD